MEIIRLSIPQFRATSSPSIKLVALLAIHIRTNASLCRDFDGKVTPEEVAAAAMYLKHTLGKEGVQELISNLSKDGGIIFATETFFFQL